MALYDTINETNNDTVNDTVNAVANMKNSPISSQESAKENAQESSPENAQMMKVRILPYFQIPLRTSYFIFRTLPFLPYFLFPS